MIFFVLLALLFLGLLGYFCLRLLHGIRADTFNHDQEQLWTHIDEKLLKEVNPKLPSSSKTRAK